MVGRRRKPSSSTVATVDDTYIRYNKESSILKPTAPDTPDHDWPCYVLTDAQIYRSDGETLANPLHVSLEGPMIIKGKLVVDHEDDQVVSNLIKPNTKTAYLEISRSECYSIGYNPIALWVSGAAGWFEIVPSPEYEPMYAQIQDAIRLYYSVMESYEVYNEAREMQKRKKESPPPEPGIEDILFDYATTLGDGIFYDEAVARCGKWAKFLISHFPKEPDLSWDETRFAQWIRQNHPDLTQKINDTAAGLIPPTPIPPRSELAAHERSLPKRQSRRSTTTSSRNDDDVEMSDSKPIRSISPSTQGLDKGKAKKISITPVPLPSYLRQQPYHGVSTARSSTGLSPVVSPGLSPAPGGSVLNNTQQDLDTLISVFKEEVGEKHLDIEKAGPAKFHQAIFFKCKIRDYRMSKEIVSFYARNLLPLLPAEWRHQQFYNWLQQEALKPQTLPEGLTAGDISEQLTRRARKTKAAASDADALPPAPISGSVAGRLTQSWDEEESEEELRPRRSGKGAVLRPQVSRKRPALEMEDDSASGSRRGTKSVKTSTPVTFEDDDFDDSSDEDSIKEEDDDPTSLIQPPKDAVRVIVHAERLPTISPSGPNGTWICDQEGCGHVVRGADDHVGEELIKAHFKWHEAQAEKIDLAMAESRGLPINHLLDKLQALGKKTSLKKRGTFPNGELLAAPIKRKLVL